MTELKEIPEKIETALVRMITIDADLREKRIEIKSIQLQEQQAVVDEKNEQGKAKHSNETAREVALAARLAQRDDHFTLANEIELLEHEMKLKQAEIDRLKLEARILLAEYDRDACRDSIRLLDDLWRARVATQKTVDDSAVRALLNSKEKSDVEVPF